MPSWILSFSNDYQFSTSEYSEMMLSISSSDTSDQVCFDREQDPCFPLHRTCQPNFLSHLSVMSMSISRCTRSADREPDCRRALEEEDE